MPRNQKSKPSHIIKCLNKKCLNKIKCWPSSPRKYCSKQCLAIHKYDIFIREWKLGKQKGLCGKTSTSKYIRRYLFEKYDNQCARCGWNKINPVTNKIPLEMEHIDGKHTNNKEKNLILLCPNCHSLTPTYKALNKGNGRKGR